MPNPVFRVADQGHDLSILNPCTTHVREVDQQHVARPLFDMTHRTDHRCAVVGAALDASSDDEPFVLDDEDAAVL